MGIDAEMFVRTRSKITEDDVRTLSYRMCDALGAEHFMIWQGDEDEDPQEQHALSIVCEWDQDGPTILPEEGETFIKVHFLGRYTG